MTIQRIGIVVASLTFVALPAMADWVETDEDGTNRFFTSVPTQEQYRDLILTEHGLLNDAHPNRYKRFIVSGDGSHTALQSPLFYSQDANGVPLNEWTAAFLASNSSWIDIVEDLIQLP